MYKMRPMFAILKRRCQFYSRELGGWHPQLVFCVELVDQLGPFDIWTYYFIVELTYPQQILLAGGS
jgi:hypothetical protein